MTRLAARSWRLPLIVAGVLFVVSGPAHALGRVDTVFYASLAAVTLGGIGVVLGYLALLGDRPKTPTSHADQGAGERPAGGGQA